MDTQRTIFIVGGAGYIGEMLCDLFNAREDVRTIVALDKEPQSDFSKSLQKVVYVQSNMAMRIFTTCVLRIRLNKTPLRKTVCLSYRPAI